MDTLSKLQKWYASHCDGEWEHGYGVEINTIDNPGWAVDINIKGTALEDRPFEKIESADYLKNNDDWFVCYIEDKRFKGRGDPAKLEKILSIFLKWAESKR